MDSGILNDAQVMLSMHYDWLRAFHIISIIAWMAGLLYLPRIFVYHADVKPTSKQSDTFKIMERRLYKYIMTPAMISSWSFGILMLLANPAILQGAGWMHAKLTLVVFMTGAHHVFGAWMKKFAKNENTKSDKFYRWANEIPTILMIFIVFLAILEPF